MEQNNHIINKTEENIEDDVISNLEERWGFTREKFESILIICAAIFTNFGYLLITYYEFNRIWFSGKYCVTGYFPCVYGIFLSICLFIVYHIVFWYLRFRARWIENDLYFAILFNGGIFNTICLLFYSRILINCFGFEHYK